jgi:hypothetical protein
MEMTFRTAIFTLAIASLLSCASAQTDPLSRLDEEMIAEEMARKGDQIVSEKECSNPEVQERLRKFVGSHALH